MNRPTNGSPLDLYQVVGNQNPYDQFRREFTFPDGRQFTAFALTEMGLTPGDLGDYMKQLLKNSALLAGGMVKAAPAAERNEERDQHQRAEEKDRLEAKRLDDQRREEEKRLETARMAEQQRLEEKRLEDKRLADADAAKNRPQEDKLNMQIATLPFRLGVGMEMLGFGGGVLGAMGQLVSPMNGLGGQMMMTTNNNGALLADVREVLKHPARTDDMQATAGGPQPIIPGLAPASPAPVQRPELAVNTPSFTMKANV